MERADFYVGLKKQRWVGSLLKYGSPYYIPFEILMQINETCYEEALDTYLSLINCGVSHHEGWPHLWEDSQMTDYVYYFDNGRLYFSMMENDFHQIIYDAQMIAITGDLDKFEVGRKEEKFPKMRMLVSING